MATSPSPGSSAGDDAAPATGSTPATGAAPLPAVELLADLPELTGDDVLALPVADGGEPPAWLTGPALFAPHPFCSGSGGCGRRRRHAWRP